MWLQKKKKGEKNKGNVSVLGLGPKKPLCPSETLLCDHFSNSPSISP